jgi:hypothetical protein
MCDEALVKFHNRCDCATLIILHSLYATVAIHIEPYQQKPLEVILMVATSFSSRHGLDLIYFALVYLLHKEIIRTAVIYGLVWRELSLGNRP